VSIVVIESIDLCGSVEIEGLMIPYNGRDHRLGATRLKYGENEEACGPECDVAIERVLELAWKLRP
jgi:hypothetical protein